MSKKKNKTWSFIVGLVTIWLVVSWIIFVFSITTRLISRLVDFIL